MQVTVKQIGTSWGVHLPFGIVVVKTEDEANKLAVQIKRIWHVPEPDTNQQ